MFLTIVKWAAGLFTGGTLDKILDTIERKMDNETKKEEIKADVTKTYVQAQANLMVGRTWWFQLFFVVPLGMWWTAVCVDSIWHIGLNVAKLPEPLDDWAAYIISALFLVDGSKAILGRFKG
ncbi:hypothetical protein [Mesorhizobium sp.]|uniref:hypothetical protein n=1 Tax=Mesorhizobium sp. TaxID=1871066 RepID=UPI000FE8C36D|nr:hypothetical protein [Mesorhizobium sp.]RWM84304.1 MAG: hypothetical protein EOR83_16915 [Mesorhizobium sp.]